MNFNILDIPVLLAFLTNINIILVVFYKYTAKYIDLHLLCLIVAFVSFGIAYVYPRKTYIQWSNGSAMIVDTNGKNMFVDLAMHWTPLIFVLLVVPKTKSIQKITLTFFSIILYSIIVNAPRLYMFDFNITFILIVFALIVRFCI